MTDNPTALPEPLSAADMVAKLRSPAAKVFYEAAIDNGAVLEDAAAMIAAQAETIERLTKQGDETGRLLDDAILASKLWLTRAEKAEAEVAALRRENEQLRVDLKLADAAQHLPAALSPKEAPKP